MNFFRRTHSFRLSLSTTRTSRSQHQKRRLFGAIRNLSASDMEAVNTSGRLAKLRELMKENKYDIYSMENKAARLVLFTNDAQSYPLKIVIHQSTLHLVMLAEVRSSSKVSAISDLSV